MLLLESLRESLKHRSSPDFVFLQSGEVGNVEAKRLREDFGVQIIKYNPSPGHPELSEFVSALVSATDGPNP